MIVAVDDVALRRQAGLAGAHVDRRHPVHLRFADVPAKLEPGVVGFHHHVDEGDADIGERRAAERAAEQFHRLVLAGGSEQFDRNTVDLEALHRQFRDREHVRVVIDQQDWPFGLEHACFLRCQD